jgi:hypothetical protein
MNLEYFEDRRDRNIQKFTGDTCTIVVTWKVKNDKKVALVMRCGAGKWVGLYIDGPRYYWLS